nr:MAG TPA: hypothetical protein [Caudoviricetes sp.]
MKIAFEQQCTHDGRGSNPAPFCFVIAKRYKIAVGFCANR